MERRQAVVPGSVFDCRGAVGLDMVFKAAPVGVGATTVQMLGRCDDDAHHKTYEFWYTDMATPHKNGGSLRVSADAEMHRVRR